MLVTCDILFEFRATFSHLNKRIPVRSENSTEWKSALRLVKRLRLFSGVHDGKIDGEAMHICQWAYCIPGVPRNVSLFQLLFYQNCPLFKTTYKMDILYNAQIRYEYFFISVSARIDVL